MKAANVIGLLLLASPFIAMIVLVIASHLGAILGVVRRNKWAWVLHILLLPYFFSKSLDTAYAAFLVGDWRALSIEGCLIFLLAYLLHSLVVMKDDGK